MTKLTNQWLPQELRVAISQPQLESSVLSCDLRRVAKFKVKIRSLEYISQVTERPGLRQKVQDVEGTWEC